MTLSKRAGYRPTWRALARRAETGPATITDKRGGQIMKRVIVMFVGALAVCGLAASAHAANKCQGAKIKDAGKKASCLAGLYAKDTAAGGGIDDHHLIAMHDPAVRGGDYYGPGGPWEMRGHPRRVRSNARSHDADLQRRLWEESERLTGVTFPLEAGAASR